jgi:hypothetical protein
MLLKTPKFYTENPKALNRNGKANFKKLAKAFCDGELREDIESTIEEENDHHTYVNTPIPVDAYDDVEKFVKECQLILEPLGYKASQSHDGGGMKTTLYVKWDI